MSSYTGNKVFAPAIFFIAFREALEAALVIGILSGMLERIVVVDKENRDNEEAQKEARKLIKKLRKYVSLFKLNLTTCMFSSTLILKSCLTS